MTDKELLERIYQLYPRKQGKSRGMKKLQKLSTSELLDLKNAVVNYRNYCIEHVESSKFIKLWSTFAGEWEDWVEVEPTINLQEEKRRLEREKRKTQRRIQDTTEQVELTPEEKEQNKKRIAELISGLTTNMKPD